MRKILNNKGFTLIELLAVIVILAILVMIAIPAVTRYLDTARQGAFADNALTAISAVRQEKLLNEDFNSSTLTNINTLLETKLVKSPFGYCYCKESSITVAADGSYSMNLFDSNGNNLGGSDAVNEKDIKRESVAFKNTTPPNNCTRISSCTDANNPST